MGTKLTGTLRGEGAPSGIHVAKAALIAPSSPKSTRVDAPSPPASPNVPVQRQRAMHSRPFKKRDWDAELAALGELLDALGVPRAAGEVPVAKVGDPVPEGVVDGSESLLAAIQVREVQGERLRGGDGGEHLVSIAEAEGKLSDGPRVGAREGALGSPHGLAHALRGVLGGEAVRDLMGRGESLSLDVLHGVPMVVGEVRAKYDQLRVPRGRRLKRAQQGRGDPEVGARAREAAVVPRRVPLPRGPLLRAQPGDRHAPAAHGGPGDGGEATG